MMNKLTADNTDMYITRVVLDKEQAIANKMKILEPKLLGIKLARYQRKSEREVFVPFCMLLFDFDISKNLFSDNKLFTQTGKICAIFDMNELHTSIYDLNEGNLPLTKIKSETVSGVVLEENCTEDEMLVSAKETIGRKVIKKAYKAQGRLHLTGSTKFYRKAWELELTSNGRDFRRYAFLDDFRRGNERVKGIKARIGD